jgi:hypothetical protein
VNHGFYAGSTFQLSHVFPGIFYFFPHHLIGCHNYSA